MSGAPHPQIATVRAFNRFYTRQVGALGEHQLKAARAIYQQAGFRCVHTQANHIFGRKLVDKTWDLSL